MDFAGNPRLADLLRGSSGRGCRIADLAAELDDAFAAMHETRARGGTSAASRSPGGSADLAASLGDHDRRTDALGILGEQLRVTASFGLSNTRGVADFRALLEAFDERLYAAKRDGRNRVAV